MKLIDRIKLSLHNLYNNKSRSFLTIIIVFVVSTLIMTIMLIGINFSTNLNKVQQRVISTSVPSIYFTKDLKLENRVVSTNFTSNDVDFILEKALKYQTVNHNMSFSASENFIYHPLLNQQLSNNYIDQISIGNSDKILNTNIISFAFPNNESKRLVDGRIWSIDDVGRNGVWVNNTFVQKYDKVKIIRSGDVIWLHSKTASAASIPNGNEIYHSQNFIVHGIIDDDKANANVYIDLSYMINNYPANAIANQIRFDFYPPKREYKFNEVYSQIDKFIKEVVVSKHDMGEEYRFKGSSEVIEQLKITKLINLIVISLSILLSIFILLLSIGSVANTIVISVDKNKKFIGLLKAIGLKQKEVVNVVQIEAIFTISIGVILSTTMIMLNINYFQTFLSDLFASLNFQSSLLNVQILFNIPIYLPIAVIIIFLLLALVFSRGSLTQIARMDVINIISEVS